MREGERQVAPTVDGIRRDHVARYEFAAKVLQPGSRVIDFACGVGYGCSILADAGHRVRGFDLDPEAIAYGSEHYARDGVELAIGNGNAPGELSEADAAVCFETIEHLEDPRPLLKALRGAAPILIASVPNEDKIPYAGQLFHHRHYTRQQFKALLQECGWCVTEWFGQDDQLAEVSDDPEGWTTIAVATRDVVPQQEGAGRHVAILGLGPSLDQFLEITKRLGGRSRFCDEVWSINALGDVFASDLVFHMDDVRIQEIRAESAPASNIAAMLQWIKTSPVPVVTSRAHPGYPALVEFPLEDVLNNLGHDYFNSTAAYAVAFAIHTGATEISIFGMDFTYPNVHHAEKGRACVEFWLGQAQARGIKVSLPKTTTLMDACYPRTSRLYGYDTLDVEFNIQPDGMLRLGMTPRETLPTAAEIEAMYDHTKPVAEQHLGHKE